MLVFVDLVGVPCVYIH